MSRWSALLLALVAASMFIACDRIGGGSGGGGDLIADLVLRLGEDTGTEVETVDGKLLPGLGTALAAAGADANTKLPEPPDSKLLGSARVTQADGTVSFFVMYEVNAEENAVAEAVAGLVDESPWQVDGGQSNEGVAAYTFTHTRSETITGTVVIQPLPTSKEFEVVVSRDRKNQTLKVQRNSFIPVLGAEFREDNGALVVDRTLAGVATDAGMREGDRLVKVGGKDVKDRASLQDALRALNEGKAKRTAVVYIVRIQPEVPLEPVFTAPAARSIPKNFPAPYLVPNGATPVAVRWSSGQGGASYQLTLLTRQSPTEATNAYRQILQQNRLTIATDAAQGFGSSLEFVNAESTMAGTITIDVFEPDDSFTLVQVELQASTGGRLPNVPGATATPGATGTPRPSATP